MQLQGSETYRMFRLAGPFKAVRYGRFMAPPNTMKKRFGHFSFFPGSLSLADAE